MKFFWVLIFLLSFSLEAKKLPDVRSTLLYVSAQSDAVETIDELIGKLPMDAESRASLLSVIKKPKTLRTSKIEYDSKKLEYKFGEVKISFLKIAEGFVEINGTLFQLPKNGSASDLYLGVQKILNQKSVLRSIFLEVANANPYTEVFTAQTATVILSADHLVKLCKENNKSVTGEILICPLFRESDVLMQLFSTEFPVSIKCTNGIPDYIKTPKRRFSFMEEKNPRDGSRETVVKLVGKKQCSVRDVLSAQTQGNVSLEQGAPFTQNQCLQLMNTVSACCSNEDECLREYSLLVDDEKVREHYQKNQKNEKPTPFLWPAPSSKGTR